MKRTLLITLLSAAACPAIAQGDFPGYRSGNYTGVNALFTNPASIADSRYYFDINLLSAATLGANDQASYKLKNFSETFKSENLRDKLFGENVGPTSGVFSLDIHGPSGMLTLGKLNRSTLALTSRARLFANVIDFDSKLFNLINSPVPNDPTLPYAVNAADNMRFSINGWSEYGISFARLLVDKGAHALKGGVSVKYLAGAVNGYINVQGFAGTIQADQLSRLPFLENATGIISTAFAGERVAGFEAERLLKNHGYGFGADLGFVYEFRPEASMQSTQGMRFNIDDKKLYKFKVAASVLDLGSILYKRIPEKSGDYNIDISNGQRLSLKAFENKDFDDYNAFFKDNAELFIPRNGVQDEEYNVDLPATLQLEADYLINNGFYLNLAGQISLSNSSSKYFNNRPYSGVTFTPRYEDKLLGIYLPLNYNPLTNFNAGLSFRIGPLFFGSGSLLTALFGSSRQADVHFGLRLGELK